jgi:hypothetical protein
MLVDITLERSVMWYDGEIYNYMAATSFFGLIPGDTEEEVIAETRKACEKFRIDA